MPSYTDNVSSFIESFVTLTKNLTIWKFIKWIIVIGIIASSILYFYEKYFSSSFYYSKLDRKLEIVEKVEKLNLKDSSITLVSRQKVLDILQSLDPPKESFLNIQSISTQISKSIWDSLIKFLGSLILPLLAVISTWKDSDRKDAIIGAVALAIVFGVISIFIPTISSPWINFIIMPFVQLIVLLPFILKSK